MSIKVLQVCNNHISHVCHFTITTEDDGSGHRICLLIIHSCSHFLSPPGLPLLSLSFLLYLPFFILLSSIHPTITSSRLSFLLMSLPKLSFTYLIRFSYSFTVYFLVLCLSCPILYLRSNSYTASFVMHSFHSLQSSLFPLLLEFLICTSFISPSFNSSSFFLFHSSFLYVLPPIP